MVFKDSAGNLPQSELVGQPSTFGGYSIGRFMNGGTGIIIRYFQDTPSKIALVLTTAHVFMEDFKYSRNPIGFILKGTFTLKLRSKSQLNGAKRQLFN